MTKDYIADTRQIIKLLEAEGERAEAASLRDAIAAGSTGGEIYMGVGWNLERIAKSRPELSPPLRKAILDLLSAM